MAISADVRELLDQALDAALALPAKFSAAEWTALTERADRAMQAAGFPPHEPTQPDGKIVGYSNRAIYRAKDLQPSQRAVAELLASHPEFPTGRYPLPTAHWALRQWIGIDPPGVLFREHEAGTLFETLRTLKLRDAGAAEAFVVALPIHERVPLLAELSLASSDYDAPHVDALLHKSVAEIDGSLGAWAQAFAAWLVAYRASSVRYAKSNTLALVLPTFVALVRAGVPIEPAFDPLLPIYARIDEGIRRDCIEAIPEPRREAAIVGALRNVMFESDQVSALQALLPLYPYPGIAAAILANVDAARRPKDALRDVKNAAKSNPAIAAAYAAHVGSRPAIPKLRVASRIHAPKLETLDEIQQAQLVVTSRSFDGRTRTAAQILATDENEAGIVPATIELLRIEASKGVSYDAWLYMSDSGTIFQGGTSEVVAEIIQSGVECTDNALRIALLSAIAAPVKKK